MSNGLSELFNHWVRLIREHYSTDAYLIERFNIYNLENTDIVKLLMGSLGVPYSELLSFEQNVELLKIITPWFKSRGTERSIQSLVRADHQNDQIEVYEPFRDAIRPCISDVSGAHRFTDSDYYRPGVYDVQNLGTINGWVIQSVRDHIPAGQKAYRTFEATVFYDLFIEFDQLIHYEKLSIRYAEAVGMSAATDPQQIELATYSYCPPIIADEGNCCPFITSRSEISDFCTLIPLVDEILARDSSSHIISLVTTIYNKYIIDPVEGDPDIVDQPPPIDEEPYEPIRIEDIDPTRVAIYGNLTDGNYYEIFVLSESELSSDALLSASAAFVGIISSVRFQYAIYEEYFELPVMRWDYVYWNDLDEYDVGDPPKIGEYGLSKVTLFGDFSYHEYDTYPGTPIPDFGSLIEETIDVAVNVILTDSGTGTDTVAVIKS